MPCASELLAPLLGVPLLPGSMLDKLLNMAEYLSTQQGRLQHQKGIGLISANPAGPLTRILYIPCKQRGNLYRF